MTNPPNDAQNHANEPYGERDAEMRFPREMAALDQWLARDGDRWRRRLPPTEPLAERIRTIPWATPNPTNAPPSAMRGDRFMTPYDDDAPTEYTAYIPPPDAQRDAPRGGRNDERRSSGRGRIIALVAAVVIVALLGAVLTELARLSHPQGSGQPTATISARHATATRAASPSATPIASAVPSVWQVVASPDHLGNLTGIAAISATDLWAVGATVAASSATTLIEHGDGVHWQIVSSPNPTGTDHFNQLNAVAAVSANDVWAVGAGGVNTLIEHWDGAQWSIIPSPNPSANSADLLGVTALASDNVWAAGYANISGGCSPTLEPLIEHWDGAQWSIATTPTIAGSSGAELRSIAAVSATDVWAVGSTVEHFDGATWSLVTPPAGGLFSVTALPSGDIWAVGTVEGGQNTNPQLQPSIAHWDGTHLAPVPSPVPNNAEQLELLAVAGASSADIWAVGGGLVQNCGGSSQPLAEHWNGQTWSIVALTSLGFQDQGYLDAVVAVSANDVWAVGGQFGQGSGAHSLIEHYTGG